MTRIKKEKVKQLLIGYKEEEGTCYRSIKSF